MLCGSWPGWLRIRFRFVGSFRGGLLNFRVFRWVVAWRVGGLIYGGDMGWINFIPRFCVVLSS